MEINEILLFNQCKKSLERFAKEQSDSARKNVVYWAIRCVPYLDNLEDKEVLIQLVNCELKRMKYRELVNMFPIDKSYDGDKWDTKDYFYTIDYIEEHGGMDAYIENPFELIWDYQNFYIRKFGAKWLSYVEDEMREQTGIDMFNAFFHTDEYAKDSKGNIISVNKQGKVRKVANPHATKLKVIK